MAYIFAALVALKSQSTPNSIKCRALWHTPPHPPSSNHINRAQSNCSTVNSARASRTTKHRPTPFIMAVVIWHIRVSIIYIFDRPFHRTNLYDWENEMRPRRSRRGVYSVYIDISYTLYIHDAKTALRGWHTCCYSGHTYYRKRHPPHHTGFVCVNYVATNLEAVAHTSNSGGHTCVCMCARYEGCRGIA